MTVGVLLAQLGTPASPTARDVRRYLREFLGDPRVIDIPGPARWLLVNAIIAPTRAPNSARAYQKIWSDEGSPLLVYGQALASALGKLLGEDYRVVLGMRYGEPTLAAALDALEDCDEIRVMPLFPHDASSSSGSAAARVMELAAQRWNVPRVRILPSFYDDPGFIAAQAELARPVLDEAEPEHVLFSYHGLPERQIRKSDPSGVHCFRASCCDAIGPANARCYRAQCFATTRALIAELGLDAGRCSTSFQSRLGRTPWIQPFTDLVLPELAASGVKRLAVLCPAFVADNLETLEEIGIRATEQWQELGGERLALVPCVNASPAGSKPSPTSSPPPE